jgi:hypothetical protein
MTIVPGIERQTSRSQVQHLTTEPRTLHTLCMAWFKHILLHSKEMGSAKAKLLLQPSPKWLE